MAEEDAQKFRKSFAKVSRVGWVTRVLNGTREKRLAPRPSGQPTLRHGMQSNVYALVGSDKRTSSVEVPILPKTTFCVGFSMESVVGKSTLARDNGDGTTE